MELAKAPINQSPPRFLSGGGEMGKLIMQHDWSKTVVGPMESWPQSLKTTLNIILKSKFPMFLWWGKDLIQFYNDAYRPSLGNNGKHPTALGQRGEDCWAEIWPDIKPLIDQVLDKEESTWSEDQLLPIYRNGHMEDVYWTFSYSPVSDESGKVGGVLVVCNETTEQVKTVKAIKQSEERFENLIREATVGIVVLVGEEMKVEIANEMYGQLIGHTPEELVGKPLFSIIPEATEPFLGMLNNVRLSGVPLYLYDYPYLIYPNGEKKEGYLNLVYQPYRDANGDITGVMALCHDATEQVKARHEIEQAEEKARLAIESAAVGTYEIKYATDEMITSERFNAIWGIGGGLTRKEITGRIHPDDMPARKQAHNESLKTGNLHYEARIVWDDGSERWVRVKGKVLFDEKGNAATLLGVVQDINDQKLFAEQLTRLVNEKAQELLEKNSALKESEERYHKMIDEVEDYAILFLDKAGIVQNWNKGAEKIKGYKEEEIVGKSFKLFYLPEDQERGLPDHLIAQATQYGKAVQEGPRRRKDGSTFWGSIVITAIHDSDNNVVGFSKVTRDLTERKIAEDKIEQYTQELEFQNEELKQFAFVASHDMKEPLRKVIYNNSYLNERINDRLDDKEKEALRRSTDAARRMQTLIDDILSYSQTAFADHITEAVDLNTIVQNVIANSKETIDETGTTIKVGALPVVNGITHQLMQLFDNLFNNAIKYRYPDRKPVITIAAEKVKGSGLSEDLKDHTYHKICITDNGIGFEPNNAEKIFELFYRLKDKKEYVGSGIGLSICRKIVQNHNGFIEAIGRPGQGATFEIYLPVGKD